jgi:hypothetical protein
MELDVKCPDCGGTGAIQGDGWADWHRRHGAALRRADVLVSQGAINPPADMYEYAAAEAGPEPDGPEEVTCGVCDGRQRIPTEEGQRILDFLDRHYGPRLAAIEATLDRAESAAIRREVLA